jgi:HAE1 family hydrophobic/amphiphilic exporter-1
MNLTDISVRRPIAITMFFLSAILLGFYSFHKLGIDFLPDIDVPRLIVRTEWPGASARDVEERITNSLEASLSTLKNVNKISSISRNGISFIQVRFNWGVDMDMAFIHVRSKLDRMQEMLPQQVERPSIMRFDPSSSPIMTLVISGDRIETPQSMTDYQQALMELKDVGAAIIKRRLEQVDGIALVTISGGLDREFQVELHKDKCAALNVSFAEIESALRRYNVSTSGGSIREGYFQYPLRIIASFQNTTEIENTPVKFLQSGRPVLLKDIANVKSGFKKSTGFTELNGKQVITLFVYKEADANTVKTSERTYNTLYHLYQEYPEFKIIPVFDQAEFIRDSINNVLQSLYLGGFFAFFILFYFLKDLKNPIIIGIAIPVSIIITMVFMYFMGINFNIISLGGLALGIGLLVDNSIVVLENITRYREMGLSLEKAALKGTKQVSLAITASTFTTISVFLPLVTIKGLAGELFYDQSVTITIALLISLIVSISLLSMLASRAQHPFSGLTSRYNWQTYRRPSLLKTQKKIWQPLALILWIFETVVYTLFYFVYKWFLRYLQIVLLHSFHQFQNFFAKAMNRYETLLNHSLDNRRKVAGFVVLAFLLSAMCFYFVQKELLPPVDRKQLVASLELPAGVNLQTTESRVHQIERNLLALPGVKRVLSSVGITENILDSSYQPALNKAILDIEIEPHANTFKVAEQIRDLFPQFPDVHFSLEQRESVFEQLFQTSSGAFDIRLTGPEFEQLVNLNNQIIAFMQSDPDFQNINSNLKLENKEFVLVFDQTNMVRYGISFSELTAFLQDFIQGSIPTQFIDFSEKIDIRVAVKGANTLGLSDLQSQQYAATIDGKKTMIPVSNLVSLHEQTSYSEINHENQARVVDISADLAKSTTKNAKQKIESFIEQMDVPPGYIIRAGTNSEEMIENYKNLLLVFVISLTLVYFILSAQFESIKIPLIIIAAIPLALVGVFPALLLTGNSLNVISFLGIIILIGIVVNDSIVKVDFIHRQVKEGSDIKTAIIQAGQKRFRPIMMTTITTICGLLPMALTHGSGAELRSPLAWVVIGGLAVATLLTLIVVPVIYSAFVNPKT